MAEITSAGGDIEAADWAAATVDAMPDAFVIADAKGLIRTWNAGAERIFGFTREEALGKSLDLIIPENQRKAHWDGYDRTMTTGETHYAFGALLAVPATHRDGTRLSIQFCITPLHDASGKMVAIAALLRDVTSEWKKTMKLRKELAEARAAAKA